MHKLNTSNEYLIIILEYSNIYYLTYLIVY